MLIKHYRNAILIPASLILLAYIIVSLLGGLEEASYESEMNTDTGFYMFWFLAIIFHTMFIGVLALPLFLNKYGKVRENNFLSAIFWFSAPIIWILGMMVSDWNDIQTFYKSLYHYMIVHGRLFLLGSIFPYLIGLCMTFRKFRKNLNAVSSS